MSFNIYFSIILTLGLIFSFINLILTHGDKLWKLFF